MITLHPDCTIYANTVSNTISISITNIIIIANNSTNIIIKTSTKTIREW